MEPIINLFQSLGSLLQSVLDVVWAVLSLLGPWLPLVGWVAFWLCAVNWQRLRGVLARGGWIGIVLLAAMAILVWGNVSPSRDGVDLFGLKISNFVEKTVYVSGLVSLMFLAGALQLSGFCSQWCDVPAPPADDHHHGHGHDHGGHEHDHSHDHGGHDHDHSHDHSHDHGHAPALAHH
jgi:hypothetical protein